MKGFLILILLSFFLHSSKIIEIDLTKQKIYAIENGKVKFWGRISSGKRGHRTPTGVFRIIEKDRHHVSSSYPKPNGGAPMPYMLRLTYSGIAIHQGELPGYPASHGCIRVTNRTAKKLWRWAKYGTKVTIYGSAYRYEKNRRAGSSSKKKYKKKSYKSYSSSTKSTKVSSSNSNPNQGCYNIDNCNNGSSSSKSNSNRVREAYSDYEIIDLY